ncbi:MAG TPA: VOC family protein [Candidatus Limnocylindria bacterium]|nr:VOC family protein [Candidatus Limnocylindria bacterium]
MEPKVGDVLHFEINTRDPKRAKTFYTKIFGWKYKDSEIPGIEYYIIDGVTPGGAINPIAEASKVKAPTVYFGTHDIDSTLKKVRDGGGTADEKQPIPGQGWFAACTDPDGNSFSLFQNDPSVTMETEAAHQEARA